jgi:hypothetical protein
MNKLKDTDLREALRRNYAERPQLPKRFMERMHEAVEQEDNQPRRAFRYRLADAITSIAAAILIVFLLWPESRKTPITQPEQPVLAEVTSPKAEPKENDEAETPAAQPQTISARKHVAVEPKPKHAIREPEPESEPVLADATRADSFDYYLTHLEAEMDALDDSVSSAQLEKLISADARLRQLVNRIVGGEVQQALNAIKPDSTTEYLNF